jgi:hypothetical protein
MKNINIKRKKKRRKEAIVIDFCMYFFFITSDNLYTKRWGDKSRIYINSIDVIEPKYRMAA